MLGNEDLPLADMVRGAHEAFLLHLFDKTRGLVVADGELALDVGGGALAVLDDDLHRLVVERVLLGVGTVGFLVDFILFNTLVAVGTQPNGANLIALVIYPFVIPLAPILFFALNGNLLGREYF